MISQVTHTVIFVKDQDEAFAFYTKKLGFQKHTDMLMDNGFRWLTISTASQPTFEISLFKPMTPEQEALVGKQAPGVPLLCVSTSDCKKAYEMLKEKGVLFLKEPHAQMWGIEAICVDLYGNMIDIVQEVKE